MRELTRSLEESTDPERRPQVEAELRIVRTRIAESQAQASSSQARLAQAREALDAETARYEELERWLGDVDRQLHDGQ
jgi:chromosome segregation ATPase